MFGTANHSSSGATYYANSSSISSNPNSIDLKLAAGGNITLVGQDSIRSVYIA
jgi:hypothetical protein